jgi:hypothetical protein
VAQPVEPQARRYSPGRYNPGSHPPVQPFTGHFAGGRRRFRKATGCFTCDLPKRRKATGSFTYDHLKRRKPTGGFTYALPKRRKPTGGFTCDHPKRREATGDFTYDLLKLREATGDFSYDLPKGWKAVGGIAEGSFCLVLGQPERFLQLFCLPVKDFPFSFVLIIKGSLLFGKARPAFDDCQPQPQPLNIKKTYDGSA